MIEDGVNRLTYAEAETIGARLCSRFSAITGKLPPEMNDEAWADLVQAVMRWAGDAVNSRVDEEAAQ